MAVNVTSRTGNVKNTRQKLNLQVVRLDDGSKVRMSTKEKRALLKNQKAA